MSWRTRIILALALLSIAALSPLAGQTLAVGTGDVRIEARVDGGYDLYVRARSGIASILLTESTKDPALKADNFAYRAADYNPVNGDEKRLLNGKMLPASSKLYSLISSTPISDAAFGEAFRILIPPVLVYGYPWSRSGTVAVGKGTYINIRAFAKPYGDYSGAFQDNPYQIAVAARPVPEPAPVPLPAPAAPAPAPAPPAPPAPPPPAPAPAPAVDLAPPVQVAPPPPNPPPPPDDRTSAKIVKSIEAAPDKTLDLVVCLDTTMSMDPYMDELKKNLGPALSARVSGFKSYRIGLVLYKDYWPDEYITRKFPFSSDVSTVVRQIKGITAYGGGDIPEAVYEALLSAATDFDWQADRRQIVLVTDAPPHPKPKGKIAFADAAREMGARGLELDSIIEPDSMTPARVDHGFDGIAKRIAFQSAAGAKLKIIGIADCADGARASADAASLRDRLLPKLSSYSSLEWLGERAIPAEVDASGLPSDSAALKAAVAAGANFLVLSRTQVYPVHGGDGPSGGAGPESSMSETATRLLEVPSGNELARDVAWRVLSLTADSSRALDEFVDGVRTR